jgi:hypothetical protein
MTHDQLLEAADQLPGDELEQFARQVVQLAASRRYKSLPTREAELLRAIHSEPDPSRIERYRELHAQRLGLSEEHAAELIALSDWLEEKHAERMKAVAELAQLRGVRLSEMMDQLGIRHLINDE